jgi:hypothetical protein
MGMDAANASNNAFWGPQLKYQTTYSAPKPVDGTLSLVTLPTETLSDQELLNLELSKLSKAHIAEINALNDAERLVL